MFGTPPKTLHSNVLRERYTAGAATSLVGGVFCTRKKVNGKVVPVPLDTPPVEDQLFVVGRYYTALKRDTAYEKRVTRLPKELSITIVEYNGTFPKDQTFHSNAIKGTQGPGEYIAMHPKVLANIIVKGRNKRTISGMVYDTINKEIDTTGQSSHLRPRNTKQVENMLGKCSDVPKIAKI